ncbi:adenine phosphoribosyltransferase [Myxococcaceae bacterium GXIMD 01537]
MSQTSLESAIRTIPDFPQQGVLFRDISPLLRKHFREAIDLLANQFSAAEWDGIDAVVGIESRGFILASGLAYARNKGLLIVRKPGKLPPPLHTVSYTLEYGEDSLEMASDTEAHRVLIIDDVLATGGTLRGTCNLCEKSGHAIAGIATLINLTGLNDFSWKGMRVRSPFNY